MEEQINNLVPVKASELLKKCKNKEDLRNICRELGKKLFYIMIFIGYFTKDNIALLNLI